MTGPTHAFCDDPQIDRLLSMIVALGTEVSVLSEQLDTLRRLLCDRGVLDQATFAAYSPSAEVQAERDRARRGLIASLLSPLAADTAAAGRK
jgi:CDP-diacylglycerol pyrophosphatase